MEWPWENREKIIQNKLRCDFRRKKKTIIKSTKLKPYHKQAELVNLVTEDNFEPEDMDENFPAIDSELTLFNFEEIKQSSFLNDKLNEEQIPELHDLLLNFSKIFRQTEILKTETDKLMKHKIIETKGLFPLLAKAHQPPGGLRCNPPGFVMQTLLASLVAMKTLCVLAQLL
ncbi:hypothetical protein AVEN_262310-1 [Araneus ventricosus]|uniref:Uncharacterized protein n=1 Tax=Araneus ventricosus TaxID=182803 RepID=A0A4Y2RB43_ARAVE|nr:hypothetical protein AVEN_262310-1 [Araneus ventricosus]